MVKPKRRNQCLALEICDFRGFFFFEFYGILIPG